MTFATERGTELNDTADGVRFGRRSPGVNRNCRNTMKRSFLVLHHCHTSLAGSRGGGNWNGDHEHNLV